MLLRLVEENRPIDEILYCDTGWEFPQMYDHLDRLEQTIGRPITRLKAPLTAEQYFYEYTARPDAKLVTDRGLSWPSHACRWCTGRLKTHVINRHLSQLRKRYQLEQYVGIAADEAHRCKDLHYPLVEWGMTEADCLRYCKARGFDWGGLYDIFRRVSCWCCPLQPLSELRMLSELVDKSPSYISYIETGAKSMSLDTFVMIANALGVTADRLLMEQLDEKNDINSSQVAALLADCSAFEDGVIIDTIKALKHSMRERQKR